MIILASAIIFPTSPLVLARIDSENVPHVSLRCNKVRTHRDCFNVYYKRRAVANYVPS